jgi:AcrR family transcriptional regulator
MSRRTKEQRRTDYLDLGAELVAESAGSGGSEPGLALAHVKLSDVADRAGVTKGAMYHIWPSQEAFWHDLLVHLLETNQLFGADQLAAIGTELAEAVGDTPTLRDYANALFDALSNDPAYFARVSLFSYMDDETVRAELDRSFQASVQQVVPVLEHSITSMGRRLIEGATVWDFAVAIAALLDGLCLQYRISPARTPDVELDDGARWSLFAASAEALLLGYTEPIDVDTDTGFAAAAARHDGAAR